MSQSGMWLFFFLRQMSFLVYRLPQNLRETSTHASTKRASKERAKALSSPVADDSASNVSVESHVSIPVVILPMDSQLVDVDDNINNIHNIDTVVEIQQPPPPHCI